MWLLDNPLVAHYKGKASAAVLQSPLSYSKNVVKESEKYENSQIASFDNMNRKKQTKILKNL